MDTKGIYGSCWRETIMATQTNDVATTLINKLIDAASESSLITSSISMKVADAADNMADNISKIADVQLKSQLQVAKANEAKAEAETMVATITTNMQKRQAEKMSYSQRLQACKEALESIDTLECSDQKKDEIRLVISKQMAVIMGSYLGVSITI